MNWGIYKDQFGDYSVRETKEDLCPGWVVPSEKEAWEMVISHANDDMVTADYQLKHAIGKVEEINKAETLLKQ